MNKIRLFIEEQEIELQEEVQVSITRQLEELTNPTVICNDYTKTVKIPMTSQNNQIFGNIYSPDRITVDQPDNLLLNMTNGNELTMNGNFFHTDKEYPVQYGHPEFMAPQSMYNSYWPDGVTMNTLTGYSVIRGSQSSTYESFINNSTQLGRQGFTFTVNGGMSGAQRLLTLKLEGTTSTSEPMPYVTIDMTGLENGTYSFSFSTVLFDTTNKKVDFKDFVFAKSNKVVWMEDVISPFGIYFDPMRKLNFRLEWNGDVLMQGYTKLLAAKQENGKGYYEVTLNGELGKVFQEMQKITFDKSLSGESEGKYFIDGSVYVNEKIDKDLVYSGWTHNQTIEKIDNPNINFWDIINFAPNNAFNEDFDYKSLEMYDTSVSAYTQFDMPKFLDDRGFKTAVGVDADSVISEGVTPRGMGDFRSYMQQPFIYFNKLFQIFQKKSEELTGYKFNLDSSWFTTSNALWYRNVVLLNSLNYLKPTEYNNKYTASGYTYLVSYQNDSYNYKYAFTGQSGYLTFKKTSEQYPVLQSDSKTFSDANALYVDGQYACDLSMVVPINVVGYAQTARLRVNFAFLIDIYAYDGTNQEVVGRICVKDEDSTYIPSGTTVTISANRQTLPSGTSTYTIFGPTTVTFKMSPFAGKNNLKFFYKVSASASDSTSLHPFALDGRTFPSDQLGNITTSYKTSTVNMNVMPLVGKSYSQFTLNDLWNNDYSLFNIILNYCKMYRIFITVDEVNKTINFIPSNKYFENYEILDWTDNLCTDKEITVKPISWDKKYVSFNYKESETELGKKYKEQYGAEWGEKKITTVYNFNTETNELFSGITPSLTYTPNILGWGELLLNDVSYYLPSEIYVDLADEDNKYVNQFGAFYLMTGLYSFDSSGKLPTVFITDDTALQQKTKTYFYSYYNGKTVTTAPRLNVIYSNNMCVFGKPLENYTYLGTAYDSGVDIYNKVWKKYVEERYNKNNKVVTCYVHLTPYDYIQFDFNHFVKIENQLYIVNKIYDYDAVTNQKVKVDLITVQDITGYTTR